MVDTLVELSDTLVTDSDTERMLHRITDRCVHVLNAQAAGVLVADDRGTLRLLAASPEYTPRVMLFEAPAAPSTWCYVTGQPMSDPDLGRADNRWPAFARLAAELGFRSMTALPMRVRGDVVGVLSLLRQQAGPFSDDELRLAQALANLATAGLLLRHDTEYHAVLAAQAQRLLTARVAVERARGILAELLGLDVDTALAELHRHAERTGQSLSETAREVIAGVPIAGRPNGAGPVLLAHRVSVGTLGSLRALVRQRIAAAGLSGSAADSFLLAIHEAATNAGEHAGGGRLWLWQHEGELWCEISDDGPGLPEGFAIRVDTPWPASTDHAGLWLIRRINPGMRIVSTPQGIRVLLRQPLPGHSTGSAPEA
ncbi:hypothetical protein L3i22_016650 [Actinoplanes sp. L3-i22]|nr:hypothetical protein L3i22_016650 [Actinoplanes sp. L3-i22]